MNRATLTDARNDDAPNENEQFDICLFEGDARALHNQRTEGTRATSNRDRKEHREALLAKLGEVFVGRVCLGGLGRHRPHVLNCLACDALANAHSDLAQRLAFEADVAAHDELVAVAFDEIERTHVRAEDLGDALRRDVEQCDERHRPSGEGSKVEDGVEALIASCVNVRSGRRGGAHRDWSLADRSTALRVNTNRTTHIIPHRASSRSRWRMR